MEEDDLVEYQGTKICIMCAEELENKSELERIEFNDSMKEEVD